MRPYPQEGAGFSLFAWLEADGTVHGSPSHSNSPAGEQARGKSAGLSHLLTLPSSGGEGGTGEGEIKKYHYKVQEPRGWTSDPVPPGFCDIRGSPSCAP